MGLLCFTNRRPSKRRTNQSDSRSSRSSRTFPGSDNNRVDMDCHVPCDMNRSVGVELRTFSNIGAYYGGGRLAPAGVSSVPGQVKVDETTPAVRTDHDVSLADTSQCKILTSFRSFNAEGDSMGVRRAGKRKAHL